MIYLRQALNALPYYFLEDLIQELLGKVSVPNRSAQVRLLAETLERRETLRSLWDPADAALLQAEEDSDNAVERAIKLTFSNGKIYVVNGYVGFAFQPQGAAGELVECTMTISGQGRGKAYAS